MERPQAWRSQAAGLARRSISGLTSKHWTSEPFIARQAICMANLPRGEITGNHIGDAPVLPDLLGQIPADEQIGSVTADGAYDARKCHDAIADRGAHAVIPPGLRPFRAELTHRINSRPPFTPRRNAKPWKPTTAGAIARNEALRASKYLGRAIWRNWTGCHRRSRVETEPLGKFPSEIPCRSVDALYETAGPTPHGPGLRPSGCGSPSKNRRHERLHRVRHTRSCGRGIIPSGERGSLIISRFVQQGLVYKSTPRQHRTKLHSTNTLERFNKEVKRRADVVGVPAFLRIGCSHALTAQRGLNHAPDRRGALRTE